MKNKHVVISPESFKELNVLSDSWNMDKKEFLEHIITYFRKTGEDPSATKKDNTVNALKQLQNTLVSFIRKHESDHLKKIVQDFEATRKAMLEQLNVSDQENKKLSEETKLILYNRTSNLILNGIELQGIGKWSVRDEFQKTRLDIAKLINRDEALRNYQKKLEDLKGAIELKRKEIENWGIISGNKEKANTMLNELLSLI